MQNDINEKMRAILIDWLVEVHSKFKVQSLRHATHIFVPVWTELRTCVHRLRFSAAIVF
jgi:Cyclin, N-terminal domain